MSGIKKLTLHDHHEIRGAKFTSFAGWNMPVSYGSSLNEHLAVRQSVGLFDVSHMGEIEVTGAQAEEFLNFALTNDLGRCKIGQAQYSLLCMENGGTVDDLILYRRESDKFLLCVNAANTQTDYEALLDRSVGFDCEVKNLSSKFGQLAIQGPSAEIILSSIIGEGLSSLPKMHFCEGNWMGNSSILSRTGYTGEDGFEIYCSQKELVNWIDAFENSQVCSVPWIGLAARDSLRLEAGFPLYGHELSLNISPVQAGLSWAIGWDKTNFVGRDALFEEKTKQPTHRVVHYLADDRRIPREGCQIMDPQSNLAGEVLSGGFSPLLKKPMGSALIKGTNWSCRTDNGWYALLRDNKIPIEIGLPALRGKSPKI